MMWLGVVELSRESKRIKISARVWGVLSHSSHLCHNFTFLPLYAVFGLCRNGPSGSEVSVKDTFANIESSK